MLTAACSWVRAQPRPPVHWGKFENQTLRRTTLRYLIFLLALGGVVVSSLALHVHYSTDIQPCSINEKWDCGIVNHSRFAMIGPVPVAAIGIAGYALIGILALLRRKALLALTSLIALAFALYLTHIEASLLQVWCLYCVISQAIIAIITLLAVSNLFARGRTSS
jgi:vitamin-K-epoxide reductase (warfarin-sensitive)